MSATNVKERKIVRKVDGVGAVFSDGAIRLDKVRLSYPWVGKPQKNVDDKGNETFSYGMTAMLPKETHREAMKMCSEAITALEKQMTAKRKGRNGKPFKYQASRKFIKNGDAVDEDGEFINGKDNPEYRNHWLVTARSPDQPQLRGNHRDPETGKVQRLTPEQAQRIFYGGCYATVLIRPWPQDNQYGIRANAELLAVQFRAKGDPFGGARRLDEDDIDDSLEADVDDDAGGWGEDDDDM